jgi:hypothetical protein
MIPDFITYPGALWPLLPPGVHDADMDEVYTRLVLNERRRDLFTGLEQGLDNLFASGCPEVFLDGSYVTAKPLPNDYEVVWDARYVDPAILDAVFLDFSNKRARQKSKYLGEYFPSTMAEGMSGKTFLEFFQNDRETGKRKGIIRVTNYLTRRAI